MSALQKAREAKISKKTMIFEEQKQTLDAFASGLFLQEPIDTGEGEPVIIDPGEMEPMLQRHGGRQATVLGDYGDIG